MRYNFRQQKGTENVKKSELFLKQLSRNT